MSKEVFELILNAPRGDVYDLRKAFATPSNLLLSEKWAEDHQEGQLAVDVADAGSEVVVVSTMAGAETDKIEVYIHNDLLTIRGVRNPPVSGAKDYFHQECYWGRFSRTIVLPIEVRADMAIAEYKNGVLIIRIPKQRIDANVPVVVVDE